MTLPNFNELEKKFFEKIQGVQTLDETEAIRQEYLGRKGIFSALVDNLKALPPEEKQKTGKDVNTFKTMVLDRINQKKSEFELKALEETLKKDKIDWTLPSYPFMPGKSHPLTQVMGELTDIFQGMGFEIAEGPEIETDENNFGALNIPDGHPARDMHDTFYIHSATDDPGSKLILRTHTSPVQIRVMREQKPPVRIIAPGKVYRHEAVDATHSSVFHQIEGLVVDKNISFADLKGTLEMFTQRFFGKNVQTRFRPSYFPFVEPGVEVDISCTICHQKETHPHCPVCKGKGWLEMLGAGMVHPNVFKAVDYDPEVYTGFAFGIGIERVAMIRYGITDMRLFYENHLDFLSQF